MQRRIDIASRQNDDRTFDRLGFSRKQRCQSYGAARLDRQAVPPPGKSHSLLHLIIGHG